MTQNFRLVSIVSRDMWIMMLSLSAMLLDHGRHRTIALSPPTPPPTIERTHLTLVVERLPHVATSLVEGALAEAAAIWKPLGVSLSWHFADGREPEQSPDALRVIIVDEVYEHGPETPLGWIRFPTPTAPEPIVHLSREAARQLIDTVPSLREKPSGWQKTLLARVMGRALAHEIGHYLLGSAHHSARGLMRRNFSIEVLTDAERVGFDLSSTG